MRALLPKLKNIGYKCHYCGKDLGYILYDKDNSRIPLDIVITCTTCFDWIKGKLPLPVVSND